MDPASTVVGYLVDVSLRSLGLAAAAWAAIGLLRIRGAAGRHAVWTLATAAMLLMTFLRPLLPPLALRVLRPEPSAPPVAVTEIVEAPMIAVAPPMPRPSPPSAPIDWRQWAAVIYGAGVLVFAALLAASYGFTGRLARASRRVDGLGAGDVFESDWIAVPMTVGLVRRKILLPAGWRQWPAEKLGAAMAHERMHVRRADWAVAVMAGLNGCLFWFHPLAWWLRRQLATLAEQACDDATLLELGRRECYAQTLLDMTAAVASGRGRMVWEAMAMARTGEVGKRIERILDEEREIPRGWSRARWLAVAACCLPLFYVAVAVRVTAAQSPSAQQAPHRIGVPGTDMERRLVKKVEPVYPPEALQAGVQGDVILETVIGADGHVGSARPISGHPLLAAAAQEAVLKYVYTAGGPGGAAGAEIGSTATVVFRLPAGAGQAPRIQDALLIYRRVPEYPRAALDAGVRGAVEVQMLIGSDGVPRDVRVMKSPSPLLNQAAAEAVPQWRYRPAMLNGVPAESESTATVTFQVAPAPQEAVPERRQTSSAVSAPVLVYRTEPEYPRLARQVGAHGIVELVATIGRDGRVKGLKVTKGPPMLMRAARDAVMQWVYNPAMENGVAVESETPVAVAFDEAAGADTPRPPAAPAQPPESGGPAPKAATSQLSQAVLVYKKDPEYPKEAQQAGVAGEVHLFATIGADGRVKSVKVLGGPPALQQAAVDAVMHWVYKPATLNGTPVENETHIYINFKPAHPAAAEPRDAGTAPPAAAPSPEPALAPAPARAQGRIARPVLIYKRDPVYPKEAEMLGAGTVELDATIGTDGHVRDVMVIKATYPMLCEPAVRAVREWIYKPTLVDGVPIENRAHITIMFKGSNPR